MFNIALPASLLGEHSLWAARAAALHKERDNNALCLHHSQNDTLKQ